MPRDERLRSQRRTLMKAFGAGTTLSMLGGTAVAQQDGGMDDEGQVDHDTGTVHTVETRITGPPTNPDRPLDFFYQPTGLHVQPGDVVKWMFTTPDHNVATYHPAFGMRRRVPTGVTAFSSPLLGWRPESIPGDQVEPPAEMGGDGEQGGDGGTPTPTPSDDGDTGNTPTPTPSDDGDVGSGSNDTASDDGPVPSIWLHAFETPGVYDLLCSPHEGFGMAMRVVVGDVTETEFETSDPEDLPDPRAGPVGLARVTLTDPALRPSNIVSEGTVAWGDLEANQSGGDGSGNGGNES